jgi:hypothetical protein
MSTRIYLVFDTATLKKRLVRSANAAQAVRHVVKSRFEVGVAGQNELVALLQDGVRVEDINEEPTVVESPTAMPATIHPADRPYEYAAEAA